MYIIRKDRPFLQEIEPAMIVDIDVQCLRLNTDPVYVYHTFSYLLGATAMDLGLEPASHYQN